MPHFHRLLYQESGVTPLVSSFVLPWIPPRRYILLEVPLHRSWTPRPHPYARREGDGTSHLHLEPGCSEAEVCSEAQSRCIGIRYVERMLDEDRLLEWKGNGFISAIAAYQPSLITSAALFH